MTLMQLVQHACVAALALRLDKPPRAPRSPIAAQHQALNTARPLQPRSATLAMLALEEEDDEDELDGYDELSLMDDANEEERMWEEWKAAQAKKAATEGIVVQGSKSEGWDGVEDESAYFDEEDYDDDDDDGDAAADHEQRGSSALQMLRAQQAACLGGGESPGVPLLSVAESQRRMMISIESVLNAVTRLSDKVDRLTAKVEQLESSASTSASKPPQVDGKPADGEWDGEVDESAWFDEEDYDDDDAPDWRDLRRA
jgi:hypothetical protein